ncbi:MAG: HEAT repeat domain-containing protein [candidate division Zixibacteria bacterium]|nr:HEAT repeat domain-containing protein [candidate division Zixibacteria bacterium]
MTNLSKPINEAILKTNLSDMAHSLVRELAMACKKVSIYGPGHPVSDKALDKPYFHFGKIFYFKRYINFNIQQGNLYLLNIRLKDTVFNGHIIQFMQLRDINALLFDRDMTRENLTAFVEQFVRRVSPRDPYYQLSRFLEEKGIDTIQVNSPHAFQLFENWKLYRGDVEGDFSVKKFCLDQLGEDIRILVSFVEADPDYLTEKFVDFHPEIITYLLPEKVAVIQSDKIRTILSELAERVNSEFEEGKKAAAFSMITSIFKLISGHPDRERIVEQLDGVIKQRIIDQGGLDEHQTETGKIRISSRNRIDGLLEEYFAPDSEGHDSEEFTDAFYRLLKTGQQGKASEVVCHLMDYMSNADPQYRQKALGILLNITEQLKADIDRSLFDSLVNDVVTRLATKRETYEYSEFIWQLFEKCRREERFDLMAKLTGNMAMRRQISKGVTIYDSMTVKKAFESINRKDIIDQLINTMIKGNHETANYIRDVLIAIGSEEIAFALSQIISHPIRQIRQQSLRILAELGKASLRVFSRIIMDDTWFDRDVDRHELPDNKWYVVRNSIFVLGSLRDEEGLVPLRLRIADNDVRVRREIVAALEKISGEEAIDLLILMAEDPVQEIRTSAINAIGIVGNQETTPLLIDIAKRNPADAPRIVAVLGKLGGRDAGTFLTRLLEDPEELSNITGGRISKDELRLAIIKALGKLGDDKSLSSIKNYQDNMSTTQKIFFKNSPVQKAITDILDRK